MSETGIDSFTDAQWAEVRRLKEEWRERSTRPVNRAVAERLIAAFYVRCGFQAPKFIWWDGPIAAALLTPLLLSARGQLRNSIDAGPGVQSRARGGALDIKLHRTFSDVLRGEIRPPLVKQLSSFFAGSVDDELQRLSIWANPPNRGRVSAFRLTSSLYAEFGAQLYAQFCAHDCISLYSQFQAALADRMGDRLDMLLGSRSAYWHDRLGPLFRPQAIEVLRKAQILRIAGVEYAGDRELLDLFSTLVAEVGQFHPMAEFCVCVDRPQVVALDSIGRLHSETGPAVAYRDGTKLYYWHGTNVPARWIESRAELPLATVLNWANGEERRAAAEIFGWARVLDRMNPIVIDRDQNPQIGTLLRCDVPKVGQQRFLRVQCGTGRHFVLPVPPNVTSARQANAWTYGLNENQYKLELRT